jgi:hypothetical protein
MPLVSVYQCSVSGDHTHAQPATIDFSCFGDLGSFLGLDTWNEWIDSSCEGNAMQELKVNKCVENTPAFPYSQSRP